MMPITRYGCALALLAAVNLAVLPAVRGEGTVVHIVDSATGDHLHSNFNFDGDVVNRHGWPAGWN